jgi:hypothetical protein
MLTCGSGCTYTAGRTTMTDSEIEVQSAPVVIQSFEDADKYLSRTYT